MSRAVGESFDFELGAMVRVNITGRIIARSEFEEGSDKYLIESERRGKLVRDWVAADRLELAPAAETAAKKAGEENEGAK